MKIMFGLIATIALSMGAFAMPVVLQEEDAAEAVPEAVQEAVQEAAPPVPEEPAPPVEPPQAPAEPAPAEAPEAAEPVQEEVAEPVQEAAAEPVQEAAAEPIPMEAMSVVDVPSVVSGEIMMAQPVMSSCCSVCCCTSCCCPPPPTPTVFCLVDPCGCSHQVCINVPACCAGEQPVICWRRGFLKRQIATLSWNCCGHQVEVVVTCFGRVIVRG